MSGLGFARKRLIESVIKTNWDIKNANERNYTFNELLFIVQEMMEEEGKKYFEHRSARRGHHIFREFVKYLLYRNLANYDSMVLITSEKGCITGDALLRTRDYPNGIQLKKLVGKGSIEVLSYNIKEKKFEYKLSDGVEYVKTDSVCTIISNEGTTLTGTYDHPILLKSGTYKQMSKFETGIKKIITHTGIKEINKIKFYIKKKKVYDVVNVKDNHNFVVNGIVVSNTGKSSAAIMMAREWCKLIGIRFNPARHIAYNNADIMRKIDLLHKFEPIVADEAIRFACIAGDSMIKTPTGLKKIEELEGVKNFEVISYNEKTQQEEIQVAEKCIKVKEDIVYEIETEDGQTIQATKDHKFLTTTGWKKLEELKDGNSIITA